MNENSFNQKSKSVFLGAATAVITPFKDDKIDFDAFGKICDWQIDSGIDGIVVAGTTGENPTLSDDEQKELIRYCVDKVRGRVKVIAGTGSNNTAHSIELTRYACDVGADAVLLVTPYYNKTTQAGLVESFSKIADASTKPCILYNVPSRTGINIQPETAFELSKHPNIQAIKEASGDLSQVAKIAELCGNNLDIYSGNDDQVVPILSLGGKGVISVLSNIMPAETSNMCHTYFNGKVYEAKKLQLKFLPLINSLFSEVNPIPIKSACAAMGLCENSLRLPLVCMSHEKEQILFKLMKDQNLI